MWAAEMAGKTTAWKTSATGSAAAAEVGPGIVTEAAILPH